MGDQKDGFPCNPRRKPVHHGLLRGGVQPLGRLVQKQERRVLQKRPGQGDPARLAARHRAPPFADLALQSLGEAVDPAGQPGIHHGRAQLILARIGAPEQGRLPRNKGGADSLGGPRLEAG